ncbi:MAG: mechanosensitive ion channel family protein [Fibrobacteria bacterium]
MVLANVEQPLRFLLPLLFLKLAAPALSFAPAFREFFDHACNLAFIGSLAYLATKIVHLFRETLLGRYDLAAKDNLNARKVVTQIKVIEKIFLSFIALAGISCMLMTFPGIRQIGVSIMASAGVAGIIVGLAAQKSIATLLAGLQVALTQPIRVEDVVIVEGEWGRIEEITLTYVVVCIWDKRRLVVPIGYFIDKAFQNWTRTSSDILGTVVLYVDYSAPIQPFRDELEGILRASPLWDRKVSGVQVTECARDAVELRFLLSAGNASDAWDLRCLVRERLLAFLQDRFSSAIPRIRANVEGMVGSVVTRDGA